MFKVSWKAPNSSEIQKYLGSTEFCDPDHLEIQEATAEAIRGALTPMEAAVKIYLFVRDEIKLHFDGPKPSIEALRSRQGHCWDKANLQVTMLRAAQIPARFRAEPLLPQLFFVFIPEAYWEQTYKGYEMVSQKPVSELIPTVYTHGLAEAYLDDRWIGCDGTFDKDLMPSALMFDWDGRHDLTAVLPWRKVITGTAASYPVKEFNEARNLFSQDMRDAFSHALNEGANSVRAMPDGKKYRLYLEVYGKALVRNYEVQAQKWKKYVEETKRG